ncbi:MAG: Nitrilase [Methanonatronarchaeales archaeon]|nr:Nitrilase [Methanonatronarchaeales archaeon]
MKLSISLVQAAFEGAGEENLEKAVSLAGAADGDIVVLPELWSGASFETLENDALTRDEVEAAFSGASQGRAVLAGSVGEERGDGFYNTSFLLVDGEVAAEYSKLHLFFEGREAGRMEPGDSVVTADVGGVRAGLSICYDLRFPELYRGQLDGGAVLLLVPSAWPLRRLTHWNLLTRARAVENQCFVAACNRVGVAEDMEMAGHSCVVGPWGNLEAEAGERERVLDVDIDLGDVDTLRERFPVLRDRRPP